MKNTVFDFDLSATINILPSLQMGLNVMNIAGSKLYRDAYIPANKTTIDYKNQRSAGLGLLYRSGPINAGFDLLFAHSKLYDASLGVNYVPFNYALISAGLNFRSWVYTVAFKLKNFRLAYISNPELLSNTRAPKISFFDGRLYGGFSFDF